MACSQTAQGFKATVDPENAATPLRILSYYEEA
jgi:hypothetical protein